MRPRHAFGVFFVLLALVAGGALTSASAHPAGWNLSGTWIGQDGGVFVVKQAGSAITWYGHSADNTTWAHDYKGTLEGDYVVGHFESLWGTHPLADLGEQ